MSSNNNCKRYSQRLVEKRTQDIASAADKAYQRRREAIATLPRVGDSILIWLNLNDTGLWWACEVLSLSLTNRFPNCKGAPDLGQRVEIEKEEGVFHPGMITSKIGEGLKRVVEFDGEQETIDFESRHWRHATIHPLAWQKGDVFAHGAVEYEPLPEFGYPCVVQGRVQFTTDGHVKPDDLADTDWKMKSEKIEDLEVSLDDEEDGLEDISSSEVKVEISEDCSSQQAKPNREQARKNRDDIPELNVLQQKVFYLEETMKSLMERPCIGTHVVNPNNINLEGFFIESVHDMFCNGARRCSRLETNQVDGEATSISSITKEFRIGSNCMRSIVSRILTEEGATYTSFNAHGRAIPSIADAVRCDGSSPVYMVADSLPTLCRWVGVNSDSIRRGLLSDYRKVRIPGGSMTVSLLQVLGTILSTEESNPLLIGVGQGIVRKHDMSCDVSTIFRPNGGVSQGEYTSPAYSELVSLREFISHSKGGRVFNLCDTVENSAESMEGTFFISWTPILSRKRRRMGNNVVTEGFLKCHYPAVILKGIEEPSRVWNLFNRELVNNAIGLVDMENRACKRF